jgi:hypothetical protein
LEVENTGGRFSSGRSSREINSGVFEKSFGELFEPLGNSRYVLEVWKFNIKGYGNTKMPIFTHFPVPEILDDSRKHADIFLKYWMGNVGYAQLHFLRRGEGKVLGAKLLGHRPLKGHFVHKTLWV